ncbi:MAG: TOBE domain-containing protein [Aigarchaeota archaeon]|nr:TOBE domain-containing protein [Candidatus Caldarchaeales archaeon]
MDKTYMGPYAMLKVEIGNNLVLTVHVHEPEILQNLNLGDRVPVCWKASDSYLIER